MSESSTFIPNVATRVPEHGDDDSLAQITLVMLGLTVAAFVLYSALSMCRDGDLIFYPRRFFQVNANGLRSALSPVRKPCWFNWIYASLFASEDYLIQKVVHPLKLALVPLSTQADFLIY